MYCGPTFTYNPRDDTYEHPLYTSISKSALVERTQNKLSKINEDLPLLLNELQEIYACKTDASLLLFYLRTVGRKMSPNFPAIEILTLATEKCKGLIDLIWGKGIGENYALRHRISSFEISDGIRFPIVGHLMLSEEKDLGIRFHLLLLLGMDPVGIYHNMALCKRYVTVVRNKLTGVGNPDVDLNFTIVLSMMFDMGMKPCDILRKHIAMCPRFDGPVVFNDEWRNTRLPNDADARLGTCISGWCASCDMYTNTRYYDQELVHDIYVRYIRSQTLFDKLCSSFLLKN